MKNIKLDTARATTQAILEALDDKEDEYGIDLKTAKRIILKWAKRHGILTFDN